MYTPWKRKGEIFTGLCFAVSDAVENVFSDCESLCSTDILLLSQMDEMHFENCIIGDTDILCRSQ